MNTYKYLGFITVAYVLLQLVSDVTAGKLVTLGIFTVSVTVLWFPFTYIFADVVTEVYGYAKARSVMWTAIACSLVAAALYQITVLLPGATGVSDAEAYARVLGNVPRILLAGTLAVWAGTVVNDYIMARLKVITKGKFLWVRTVGSTVAGEGVNTIIFYTIAFIGILPNPVLITAMLSGWFLKTVVEIVMTPVTYRVVRYLKRVESEDHYDTNTNFNPFILSPSK